MMMMMMMMMIIIIIIISSSSSSSSTLHAILHLQVEIVGGDLKYNKRDILC